MGEARYSHKGLLGVLKWGFFGTLLVWLANVYEGDAVVRAGAGLSWAVVSMFGGLTLASRLVYTWRWWAICRQQGVPWCGYGFLLRTNLLGEFTGLILPSVLGGDAVRVAKLKGRSVALGTALKTLVVDRLSGMVGVVLTCLPVLPDWGLRLLAGGGGTPQSPFGATAVALGGMAVWDWLAAVGDYLKAPFFWGMVLLSALANMVLSVAFAGVWVSLEAIGFSTALGIMLMAQLIRLVPLSVLGLGLGDGSILGMAALLGASGENALVLVLLGLGTRYLLGVGGLLAELALDGRILVDQLRRREPEHEV